MNKLGTIENFYSLSGERIWKLIFLKNSFSIDKWVLLLILDLFLIENVFEGQK